MNHIPSASDIDRAIEELTSAMLAEGGEAQARDLMLSVGQSDRMVRAMNVAFAEVMAKTKKLENFQVVAQTMKCILLLGLRTGWILHRNATHKRRRSD